MSSEKHSLIIDTDPGVDDAFALFFAFMHPSLDVRAITITQGNTHVKNAFRNAKQIIAIQVAHEKYLAENPQAGVQPPMAKISKDAPLTIAIGAGVPMQGEATYAHFYHGDDGMGNYFTPNPPTDEEMELPATDADVKEAEGYYTLSERNAEDEMIHQLETHPEGTITIAALGPLTNVAKAIQKAPETMKRVKQIICMGGAINVPGNITPVSEFNWYADGLAAHIVIASDLPVKVLPLDVTMEVARVESKYLFEHVAPLKTPLSDFISKIILHVLDLSKRSWGYTWLTLHDPLTIAGLVDPSVLQFSPLHFEVEPSGKFTSGMCIVDQRPPKLNEPPAEITKRQNIEVALTGDLPAFLKTFYKTLFRLDWNDETPVVEDHNGPVTAVATPTTSDNGVKVVGGKPVGKGKKEKCVVM
ncbi:hypothetical protein HDU85_005163 [Gaertneriomyces sp. JEL0708]|nr:hypothetical protein HDU85_005163 [Gaertneriomyces sp. JEL0708]